MLDFLDRKIAKCQILSLMMTHNEKLKVLLIYPYFLHARVHSVEDIRVVPQGLHYIAALLKENRYDVDILNWYNIHETPEMIETVLRDQQPAVIGFSILHANRWGGIEIARIARKINPGVKIVFGGIGASFLWEHLLAHFAEIDAVVIGEGEYPFLNLIRHFNQETTGGLAAIKGLAYREDGRIRRTEASEAVCELDELPNPAKYLNYQHVSLTRGCVWNCHFCGSPQYWGRKVRFHSTDYFVRQLEMLYQKGTRFFYVSDDTFTINKRRTIEICKTIIQKELTISWAAISRVDYVNEDVLYWMRKAGCIQISYGVESGSKKIRRFLNKKISNQQIKQAFDLTQRYGILARAYFIYGCPQEDQQTIQETLDLIKEIKPLSALFYILDLFPGTGLYADLMKRLNMNDDIWLNRIEDIMYFEVDPELTQDMILAFGQKLRGGFYENLPDFVDSIRLIEDDEFDALHSDFYSRLAMTFDHGDYARIAEIPHKTRIAEKLYRKALEYHPNARAYLGLGILNQKNGALRESTDIVSEGIAHFPEDVQLNLCMGVSYMNLGRFEEALVHLRRFKHVPEALQYAARCYQALNDHRQASACLESLKAMQKNP